MGIFDFFIKKKPAPRNDLFSLIGCDIHSHFVPGIDDGAKDLEDSIAMISGMMDLGYQKVITTPHIMADFFQNDRSSILGGLELVKDELENRGIAFSIEAAAEYYLDFDFPAKLNEGNMMTFGKNFLLFELSYLNAPDSLSQTIFEMQTKGFRPVMAHPERYPYWYKDLEKYREIKEKGVLLQLNINSISGFYSPDAKKVAEWLIEQDLIDLLGSDCHHLGHINLMKKSIQHPYLIKLIESGRLMNRGLL
jgi:protein-tyrosine phosphatase